MSCGCKHNQVHQIGTRAGMCQTCPKSAKDDNGSAVSCTVNGKAIIEVAAILQSPCPIGRFGDKNTTRWLGMDWIGVPEPLRWILVWKLKRTPLGLDGCGCVNRVKESWAGKYLEPWLEGIPLLRARFAAALAEMNGKQESSNATGRI